MIKNKCFVCGGINFRADRALSGRLVCTSCGNPYGVRIIGRNNSTNSKTLFINNKKIIFIIILIIGFILVVI